MFHEVSGTLHFEDKKVVQFSHSWSTTCFITAGPVLVISQLVNICSITAGPVMRLMLYLFTYLLTFLLSYLPIIVVD